MRIITVFTELAKLEIRDFFLHNFLHFKITYFVIFVKLITRENFENA